MRRLPTPEEVEAFKGLCNAWSWLFTGFIFLFGLAITLGSDWKNLKVEKGRVVFGLTVVSIAVFVGWILLKSTNVLTESP